MKKMLTRSLAFALASFSLNSYASPSLTIYNQNFAVVRDTTNLELKKGVNTVDFSDVTSELEPDSVILRDPKAQFPFQILEQNYRSDPTSQQGLLSIYEGKVINFAVGDKVLRGKIVRGGSPNYGQPGYRVRRDGMQWTEEPLIEIDKKLRFGLPGTPLFPGLSDDSILRPMLQWIIESPKDGNVEAELAYLTAGLTWEADYNVVAPPKGDILDLVGWITINNQSGKAFADAKIKLMAGDVNKVQEETGLGRLDALGKTSAYASMAPAVSEKSFDEFHLYSLKRQTTLRNLQKKQVEFIRAQGVKSKRLYVYDGAKLGAIGRWQMESIRQNQSYGTESNTKVWVMQQIENSKSNGLGMPLPRGRLRFYRKDDDGRIEFTGENVIDHTPQDETLRVYTGNAFDFVGERKRTDYRSDQAKNSLDETFEIRVRNHRKETAEIMVVEHLYRWTNFEITKKSHDFTKRDSQTIEFPVRVKSNNEAVVTYTVHYSW